MIDTLITLPETTEKKSYPRRHTKDDEEPPRKTMFVTHSKGTPLGFG